MKCRNHPYEHGPGVCAACLRDRLVTLAAAQNVLAAGGDPILRHRISDPPLLDFPRSVSPYVGPRRSDVSAANHRRILSTPAQIGQRKKFSGFGSWISALVPIRWRRSQSLAAELRSYREAEVGMSPARSEGSSGYSTEDGGGRPRWPHPTPMKRAVTGIGRGVSGFAVCLSPLVRASPGGRRCGAADQRFAVGPNLAPNRSRKLADFGRTK